MSSSVYASGKLAPFGQYANWYDRFNDEKDYSTECEYVLRKVSEHTGLPHSWLDVGCGTGRHAAELARKVIHVEGVDCSMAMITQARRRFPKIQFHTARADEFRLSVGWDVVSMLFHVVNYIIVTDVLKATLSNMAAHLAPSGVLVFDFWQTSGVVLDPPKVRSRSKTIDGRQMFRVAIPSEDRQAETVSVNFEFRWDTEDGPLVHQEIHTMRHFSLEFLRSLLRDAGLGILQCEGWMKDRNLSEQDWYGLVVAGKK